MILIEETDNRYYVEKSLLPNAGLGVFAKIPLKKGDHMEIIGVQVKVESVEDVCTGYAKAYKFAAKPGTDFTRHVIPMGYAAIVNHGSSEVRNCELRENRGSKKNLNASTMIYLFIKDIEPGEELLGNYGGNYAEVLEWTDKYSNRIDEDEWETFLSANLYNTGFLKEV